MIRNLSLVLLPAALAGVLGAAARGVTCDVYDEFGNQAGTAEVTCDGFRTTDPKGPVEIPAVDCNEPPPVGASVGEMFRWECCCSGVFSSGALNEFSQNSVAGIRFMPADLRTNLSGFFVNENPDLVEAGDFTQLQGLAARTKETHKLTFETTLLPKNFSASIPSGVGGTNVGLNLTPVAMHLYNDSGIEAFSAVSVESPRDLNGNKVSGLNGFADIYLDKGGQDGSVLGFLESGKLNPAASLATAASVAADGAALSAKRAPVVRDATKRYFHVVEKVRKIHGERSIRSDSLAIVTEVQVRVYSLPRVSTDVISGQ